MMCIVYLLLSLAVAAAIDRFARFAGGWIWFAFVQLVMGVAALLGLILLAPACWAQWWTPSSKPSIKDGRPIDRWRWPVPNWAYGNPEDGVSGQQAKIWNENGVLIPFLPQASAGSRAYQWSALRNSAGGLKYLFAWADGPYRVWKGYKLGWQEENGIKVPVL